MVRNSAQTVLALAAVARGAFALPQNVAPSLTTSFQAEPTLGNDVTLGANILPNLSNGSAVDAQTVCPGYKTTSVIVSGVGVDAQLTLNGDACNVYGTDIQQLQLRVRYQTKDRLSVNIFPTTISSNQESWYIADDSQTARPSDSFPVGESGSDWVFTYTESPFTFKVSRKSTGEAVFDTTGTALVFENQFVEFKSALPPNNNIYGLGDAITDRFRLGINNRTMWGADIGDEQDANLYGTHPFYLEQRYAKLNGSTKGFSHGVYSRNFHGQDILLRDDSITFRIIGGSVELYFYSGPTPAEVTKSYVADIGLPALQQYWTLGFHQCRWGYANVSELAGVVQSYKDFGIPLETMWSDIDYMNQFRDFSTDSISYPVPEFAAFLEKLHTQNQHYVPIVDAAIYVPDPSNSSDAYDIFTKGNESDVFIKNPDGSLYVGAVWPGYTAFPDWSAVGTQDWWTESFATWFESIKFDGIWLDMNEVSSFCTGSCGSGLVTNNPIHPPFALPGEIGNQIFTFPEGFANTNASEAAQASASSSSQVAHVSQTSAPTSTVPFLQVPVETDTRNINYPPYAINNFQSPTHDLALHAISPNATHADGTLEYDVHSLWGFLESRATYTTLLSIFPGKRPFIISRSSAPGSGHVAGHWGGDNTSTFYYMRRAIQQAFNFGLFGMPMFGVDTCGFNGNTDMELCSRWMQLSALLHPFYRNHNVKSAIPQEAYRWESVANATKVAMQIRYSLLPYFYTLLYNAHTTGATVVRALSWEFPDDPSLVEVDAQFMLGTGIMVLPVLDQGNTTVSGVFPGGKNTVWYDWYTGVEEKRGQDGSNVTVDAPLGHIPVYVKGGTVLPLQQPGYTTTESRQNPFEIIVALDRDGKASGSLYLDDGESVNPTDTTLLTYTVANSTLFISATSTGNLTGVVQPLASVRVFGAQTTPRNVTIGNKVVDTNIGHSGSGSIAIKNLASGGFLSGMPLASVHVDADVASGSLTINDLEEHTSTGEWAQGGWTLSWA